MTKSQQIYPTDLNDTQWTKIRPYLPAEAKTGRPREHGWRMLPRDLPPWKTVYHYFWLWRTDGTWERLNRLLREKVRLQFGKKRRPSAAILDSQSIQTSEGGLDGLTLENK